MGVRYKCVCCNILTDNREINSALGILVIWECEKCGSITICKNNRIIKCYVPENGKSGNLLEGFK